MRFTTIDFVNKILNLKGMITKIRFNVDGKIFEAFVFDDEIYGAVKDILLNREYEYLPNFELINFKGKKILDAGSNVGLFSLVASKFAKKIIAVEPHPKNYELLQTNINNNNVKNIKTLNTALWHKKCKIKLYEKMHSGSHSIFPSPDSRYYEVSTTTINEIINRFGDIDLLKMDIEGSEFEIFKKMNKTVLKHISYIVAEVHSYGGDVGQIIKFLENNGFETQTFYPPIIKKSFGYKIEVEDLVKMKIVRWCIYTISSLARMKDKERIILFAKKVKQ